MCKTGTKKISHGDCTYKYLCDRVYNLRWCTLHMALSISVYIKSNCIKLKPVCIHARISKLLESGNKSFSLLILVVFQQN